MAFNIGHFHRQAPHFIVQLGCKACQQVQQVHSLNGMIHFARNHQFYWQEARHRLILQVQVMSKYLLRQTLKRKNLALSLQTGLRKKRTNFLRRGPQNSVSCEELHKEKKSKFRTISILCTKKGVQRARERYSR